MNKVHRLSSVTTIPALELFSVNPTQAVVEKTITTEFRPLSAVNGSSCIQFRFPTPSDQYLQFNETYLYVKIRFLLERTDDQDITLDDWKKVIPANYLLHSLFKQVELVIGDEEIIKAPQTYAYKSYIEALLGFSDESKKSSLTSSMWHDNGTVRSLKIAPGSTNLKVGKTIELMGRLHLDFTFQPKALVGGTTVGLKFTHHDPSFFLQCSDPKLKPSIEFLDASIEANFLRCYPHLVSAHEKALRVATAKYPLTRCEVKSINVSENLRDIMIDNVVSGVLPRRIFVMCVSNEAYNGSLTTNPFEFKDFGINHIACFLDGIQHPSRAFEPNFAEGLFVREYLGFLRALNQNTTDSYISFDQEEYKKDKVIFGFNFSPDLTDGMGAVGHTSPLKRGTLRMQVKFDKPLPTAINVLIYCEYDTVIEINELRQPVLNYF